MIIYWLGCLENALFLGSAFSYMVAIKLAFG